MKRFLIADTHFEHKNIIVYENRPFDNIEEMTETMIERWNKRVSEEDVVFHLGDLFLCDAKKAEEIALRLNGRKHLILGNHDRFTKTKYEKMGFKVHTHYLLEDFLLTHYPQGTEALKTAQKWGLLKKNIHGHVHSKTQDLDPTVHQCVSVELTNYQPISFDFFKENNAHYKM